MQVHPSKVFAHGFRSSGLIGNRRNDQNSIIDESGKWLMSYDSSSLSKSKSL